MSNTKKREWYDIKSACEYLGFSRSKLHDISNRKENPLPKYYPPGGTRPLYNKHEMDEWVKSGGSNLWT